MEVIIKKDYEEISALAAQLIAKVVRKKPNAVLGLATGSTPVGTYKELIRLHKEEGLDFSKVPPIVARILGVPRIFSVYVGGRDDLLSRVLYWCSLRFNEKVIFQNSEHLDSFVKHEIVSSKRVMRVPGSGVDTDMFAPRPDAAQSGHFLLVSRMLWDKGIAQYVAAARRLKSRYPDAVFALLGPRGDNPSSIPQEILDEWNAEGNILYYGATADVRPYLANCSVYVLPSYYREGVPRTNLEALAMGKAIVTTNMPGCRETVISGYAASMRAEVSSSNVSNSSRTATEATSSRREASTNGRKSLAIRAESSVEALRRSRVAR